MRATLFIVLSGVLLTILPSDARAQVNEATRLLDEGNAYFREGDFDLARRTYEQVLGLGLESGTVYYNLGNAYYRLDRLGKAMLNYQRAARFFPNDVALSHNIDLVQSRARDQLSLLPPPVFSRWWNAFVDSVGLRPLFWSGVLAWLGGLVLVGRRLMTGTSGAAARRASTMLVLIGFFAGAGAVASSMARADNISAVVTSDRADVMEEPSNTARIVLVVHEALIVDVLARQDRWVRVRLPNGVTGFVEWETIETI